MKKVIYSSLSNSSICISDPSKFPDLQEGELPDVSPPTFTQETRDTRDFYTKQSGDAFKVNCEATGNPRPEIFWYKDGLPFDADGIKYRNGKSTLKLRNLMKVDSALYTCLAKNLIGSATKNFTLSVEVPLLLSEDQPTVVGNGNASVLVGDTASLQCRVNSRAPPHIKWLKKQSPGAPSDMFTINVGEDRYRVIHTGEDIPVGADDYLNKLVIVNAQESDSGLYICFVTNSGGSFNYKPSYLRVYPASAGGAVVAHAGDRMGRPDNQPGTAIMGSASGGGIAAGESTHVLALVVCLGVTVVLILIFIIVCVVRKSTKAAGAGSSAPDSPEVVRNLMAPSRSLQSSSTITTVASNKFDQPLPPPPSMWASASLLLKTATGGSPDYLPPGGTTRDFASLHENSSTNLLSDRESPVSVTGGNQYEVPYCHSVGTIGSRYSVPHPQQHQQHSHQQGGSTMPTNPNRSSTPGLSEQGGYPFRHYPYFQYLNDYDSY